MRQASKAYLFYYILAFALIFVSFALLFFDIIPVERFFGVYFIIVPICILYLGIYYRLGGEVYKTLLSTNLLIKRKNLSKYDTKKMMKDLGTFEIVAAILMMIGGLHFLITGRCEFIIIFTIVAIIVSLMFYVVCRRGKYRIDLER